MIILLVAATISVLLFTLMITFFVSSRSSDEQIETNSWFNFFANTESNDGSLYKGS